MSNEINPAAPHHLPVFITAPGETDVFFNAMLIFLVLAVLLVVVFYFKLHSLPERIAHKGQKIQFELVAVLALISLFTHNHIFWIAGLLLAFIPLPDFSTPLTGMSESLARIAGWRKRADDRPSTSTSGEHAEMAPAAIGSNGAQVPGPVQKSAAAPVAATTVMDSSLPAAETSLNGAPETGRPVSETDLGSLQRDASVKRRA